MLAPHMAGDIHSLKLNIFHCDTEGALGLELAKALYPPILVSDQSRLRIMYGTVLLLMQCQPPLLLLPSQCLIHSSPLPLLHKVFLTVHAFIHS